MADTTLAAEPVVRDMPGIEDQLWPIVCATSVLVGVLATVIFVNSDFDDERLFFNGYTQLVGVAARRGDHILGLAHQGSTRRTAELAILLSLALHAAVGLGAGYIFDLPIAAVGSPSSQRDVLAESEVDVPPPADYHWGQNDDAPPPEQAFKKPIVTRLRDLIPPAAQVEPRNLERPVPVAEVPRTHPRSISPRWASARTQVRPNRSKFAGPTRPSSKTCPRRKPWRWCGKSPTRFKFLTPPRRCPTCPSRPRKPATRWAPEARRSRRTTNTSGPRSRRSMPIQTTCPCRRRAAQPAHAPNSVPLPTPQVVAQLPSQAPPARAGAAGPDEANMVSQAGGTPARSDRGDPNFPSAVAPDPGLPARDAAPAGGSPGSRLGAESNVPVERSETSRPPLGPSIAAAGHQDFARGGSLLPTRRGAMDADGRAQPSIEGNAAAEAGEVRAGSPGSNSAHGLPLAIGPARRTVASQTDDGGDGLSADQSARLPRTQAETGLLAPAAARIAEDTTIAGDGRRGNAPGEMTSSLELGQNIGVRPVADHGAARQCPQ